MTLFCISAFVVCPAGKESEYLLLRRCSPYLKGTWQMVSGGIEKGETAYDAALREIQEETGLNPHLFYSADAVETFYMQSLDRIVNCPVFVGFVKEKEPIRLSPHEHDAYEWLSFEKARACLVFAEQKRAIAHIHENFVLRSPDSILLIESTR